ncbi:tetratricopeptide repeat protein [Hymenobacter volaticus]|uniref:Tetratricopeptide repeat protein n=1 Tax=Hymenobacter volaticus TaxID=2932254 RepID=A0ABY4GFE7_9BACT|nr:tetratricopeptide repeat protein [Hymenobacter volaticus]UOQ69551.1 tetratricopeptide repeat protein [Hymenobacter volaticus]
MKSPLLPETPFSHLPQPARAADGLPTEPLLAAQAPPAPRGSVLFPEAGAVNGCISPHQPQAIAALRKQMQALIAQARFAQALPYGQILLDLCQRQGVGPQKHLELLREVGTLYQELGHYRQALACSLKALAQQERIEPAREVDLVHARYELGIAYRFAGHHKLALPLLEQLCRYWQQRVEGPSAGRRRTGWRRAIRK